MWLQGSLPVQESCPEGVAVSGLWPGAVLGIFPQTRLLQLLATLEIVPPPPPTRQKWKFRPHSPRAAQPWLDLPVPLGDGALSLHTAPVVQCPTLPLENTRTYQALTSSGESGGENLD